MAAPMVKCVRDSFRNAHLPGGCILKRAENLLKLAPPRSRAWYSSTAHHKQRRESEDTRALKRYGQPAPHTHPHKLQPGEVTPGISKQEYKTRRTNLIHNLIDAIKHHADDVNGHLVLIPSSSKVYMSPKIMYPFRQNTDFNYLTGFLEADSLLAISADSKGDITSMLFVPVSDSKKELWDGPCAGTEGATDLTGVCSADSTYNIEAFVTDFIKNNNKYAIWYDWTPPVHAGFHEILAPIIQGAQAQGHYLQRPNHFIHKLRVVKSASEVESMKKAAHIATEAFVDVMKFSRPGFDEAYLYARMDFKCRMLGADMLGYIPVVAGGNRANTVHYIQNNQIVEAGDLVLMDAGCNYNGYNSDVTRTWPISGTFTPAQRAIYQAVYRVQLACIDLCRPGQTINKIYSTMIHLIGQELKALGIVDPTSTQEVTDMASKQYCPYNVGHYLGMDVHDTDTIPYTQPLKPGMIITIEPGLHFQASKKCVPAEYRGIGIRIEDDILITPSLPVILTENCPKHINQVEEMLKG